MRENILSTTQASGQLIKNPGTLLRQTAQHPDVKRGSHVRLCCCGSLRLFTVDSQAARLEGRRGHRVESQPQSNPFFASPLPPRLAGA